MNILGIESSCDETAAAIVTSDRKILSNVVWSQLKEHAPYGGVVPEIAARAHIEMMDRVIQQALDEAGLALSEIDVIAATGGPGLIGGVMVGMMTAKALALAMNKPLIAVNHLEGHALTVRLTHEIEFPYLLLLISGGHCQWLAVSGVGKYQLLGATRDDALGEAFDKTAKMLGLPYPGGPQIEQMATLGDAKRFDFPRPLTSTDTCDFSFSGLKTAVLLAIQALKNDANQITEQDKRDICASFQRVAGDCIVDRLRHAMVRYSDVGLSAKQLVIAGGVAANHYLRGRIEEVCITQNYKLILPPMALCTDNAAMIAWAGYEQFRAGNITSYDFEPRARWPLYG
jgi:N6-L-threonylcarbamoyladenine synthase